MPPTAAAQTTTGPGQSAICPTPIIIAAVFAPIAIAAVSLRFYARHLKGVSLMLDDWMILPALFFALGQAAVLVTNAVIGDLGNHQPLNAEGKAFQSPELEVFQILEYVSFITFVLALAFAKLSVLHLYLRIFDLHRTFRITVWTVYGINLAWGICFFFGYVWKCDPIPDYWLTANLTGRCLPNSFNYAFAFSNIVLDAVILILPLPMVWSLNMSRRQKTVVSGIFLMGSFVVLLSIAKAVAFFTVFRLVEKDNDIMFDEAPLFYFSVPEALFAVTSACLPTLRPILKHFRMPLHSATSRNYQHAGGRNGSAITSLQGGVELKGRGLLSPVASREQPYRSSGFGEKEGLDGSRKSRADGVMWESYTRKSPEIDARFANAQHPWRRESDVPATSNTDMTSNASTIFEDDHELLHSPTQRTLDRIVEPGQHPTNQVRVDTANGNPNLQFNWNKPLPPEPTARWFKEFGPRSS